jgi:ABC-type nickel/cobalt efflux system permease component RcnA
MSEEILILSATAASLGFFHTILGPDHYLPFIVMSRARNWSIAKTTLITFLCGAGHILGSVVLGFAGVAFGVAVMRLESLEAFRGNLAAWALIGFGLAYTVWGIRQAVRKRPHSHGHLHDIPEEHIHEHAHTGEHAHVHFKPKKNITPWILFTIFVLGPCEPLIPILMYPAAKNSVTGLIIVTAVFGGVTILTMMSVVLLASWGISFAPLGKLERYVHAIAGASIFLSGIAIRFLGL